MIKEEQELVNDRYIAESDACAEDVWKEFLCFDESLTPMPMPPVQKKPKHEDVTTTVTTTVTESERPPRRRRRIEKHTKRSRMDDEWSDYDSPSWPGFIIKINPRTCDVGTQTDDVTII